MGIARDSRPGHIGTTPQDTDATIAGGRVAGMLHDFTEHLEPDPRVDAYLGIPAMSAVPGYFRDDWTALQITESGRRAGLNGPRQFQTPKGFGA